MVLFQTASNCCGCGACALICPKSAITMQADECGFSFPKIDPALCIGCGLCKTACDFQKDRAPFAPEAVYAVMRRDARALRKSASGGAFAAMAENVIQGGGVVFGAVLKEEDTLLTPIHCMAENEEALSAMYGSKYVQSDLRNTFLQAKQQLASGRTVLFSGTPCQIGGLKAFLRKEPPNLLTIDLVCHGVPSAKMFQDYIKILQKKLDGHIIEFSFRDKTEGWGLNARVKYRKADGSIGVKNIPSFQSSYYEYFLRSELYRDSCYHCPYAGNQHPADITIGDYWGFEEEHPESLAPRGKMSPQQGISVLIVNTEKGRAWFDRCQDSFFSVVSEAEKAVRHNKQLKHPSTPGENREKILNLYLSKGYGGVDNAFVQRKKTEQRKEQIKSCLHRIIPKPIRSAVKRIIGMGKSL